MGWAIAAALENQGRPVFISGQRIEEFSKTVEELLLEGNGSVCSKLALDRSRDRAGLVLALCLIGI
jgi:hypothetical protein